jgi:hypothetical protein
MRNIFRWKKRNKSYSEVKRELEVRDEIYGRMTTISDIQLDKWVETRLKLQKLKLGENSVVTMVHQDKKVNK